jgi:phospholipid/cholesterol/gamma-HCH transport system permease protein
MEHPADFRLETTEAGKTAVLTGDWTAVDMGWANERLGEALKGADGVNIDLSGVGRCDTSGVWGVIRAAEQSARPGKIIAPPATERLFELVRHAITQEPTPTHKKRSFYMLFDRIGRGVVDLGINIYDTLIFNGHLLFAVARACAHPRRIRWAPVFSLMERAGLDAMPIVATTTFFIGAVVGLLGANMLSQFGAQVFAVELIGIAVLREFNILITALLLAGRSASSFAAEIGSMKMNQEIDAMKVMGVDPYDALVFPRFLALLLTIPLLTFVATIAGLVGGLTVAVTILGLSPEAFFQRLVDNVGVKQFWIGMSKAPVMAMVIAGIGCRQGLDVGGDVESLGRRVTAAVVHAIFAAILIDAIFALIYMKLNV